jgi:hypothetical protein
MIRQIGIGDGHVVTAAVSDVPNSYSQPQADNGTEDQSAVCAAPSALKYAMVVNILRCCHWHQNSCAPALYAY